MTEIWKPITTALALYECSNLGNVRRIATFGGKPRNKPMKPKTRRDGYIEFSLCEDGRPFQETGHRLVWKTFSGPIPKELWINHKNGIKGDNRLENLEVMTPSENTAHGFRVLGRKAPNNPSPGEKNGSAKLTEADVREIRKLYGGGHFYQYELAKMYGVTQRIICMVTRRELWKHVE